jgi:hypothetical protein
VVHVVVMVVVMMVMMVMVMHLMGHRRGWRRRGFLRDGVSGQADCESGGGDKTLDHGNSCELKDPQRVSLRQSAGTWLNSA